MCKVKRSPTIRNVCAIVFDLRLETRHASVVALSTTRRVSLSTPRGESRLVRDKKNARLGSPANRDFRSVNESLQYQYLHISIVKGCMNNKIITEFFLRIPCNNNIHFFFIIVIYIDQRSFAGAALAHKVSACCLQSCARSCVHGS